MNEFTTTEFPALSWEPEDLDGHTYDELSDYLEAGRTPARRSIDESPGCRIALDALERLSALSPELLAADTAAEEPQESWVEGILAGIRRDARAGRRVPILGSDPSADLGITEGAIRGLIRAAELDVPGIIVGRVQLAGDIARVAAPTRIIVETSVVFGAPVYALTDELRAVIASRLATHTSLNVTGIDIEVSGLHHAPSSGGTL